MSDNWIKLIPINCSFVPERKSAEEALLVLKLAAPDSDEANAIYHDKIEYIDPICNWEGVECPICNAEISEWFFEKLYEFHESGSTKLTFTTDCCNSDTNLNDLKFKWPAGFASFELEAMNPNLKEIPEKQIHEIENILQTKIKSIWIHM